jgi:hypothetical protein
MRRTARLPLPLLLITLVLAGCTQPDPMPTPPPTPSAVPVFASDEEALAAAEEAYGKYLETVDAIFADGGADPERLLTVASQAQYESELPGFLRMQDDGVRGTGRATFTLTLQGFDATRGEITVYSCDDISGTDIVDAAGTSVVGSGRANLVPYEVRLSGDPLIVEERTLWQGSGVCS